LHVWLGFYENAFRLLRECYAELDRDPPPALRALARRLLRRTLVGMVDPGADGGWCAGPAISRRPGLPGDPLDNSNPSPSRVPGACRGAAEGLADDLQTQPATPGSMQPPRLPCRRRPRAAGQPGGIAGRTSHRLVEAGGAGRCGGVDRGGRPGRGGAARASELPENVALRLLHALAGIVRQQLEA